MSGIGSDCSCRLGFILFSLFILFTLFSLLKVYCKAFSRDHI